MTDLDTKLSEILEKYYSCGHHAAQNCSCDKKLIEVLSAIKSAIREHRKEVEALWTE